MDTACLAVIASKAGAVASSPEDDPRFSSGCRDALAAHRAALAINPTLDNALMAECRDTVQSEPFVAFCQKAFPKATPPLPPLLVTSCLRKLRAAGRLGEGCSLQVQRLQSDEARDMTLDARLFAACEPETKGEGPCASVAAGGGRLRACLEKEAAAQKAPPAMCTGADLGPSRGLLAPAFALALAPATGTGPWHWALALASGTGPDPDPDRGQVQLALWKARTSGALGGRAAGMRSLRDKLSPLLGGTAASAVGAAANAAVGAAMDATGAAGAAAHPPASLSRISAECVKQLHESELVRATSTPPPRHLDHARPPCAAGCNHRAPCTTPAVTMSHVPRCAPTRSRYTRGYNARVRPTASGSAPASPRAAAP